MSALTNKDRAARVAALLQEEGIDCEGVSVAGAQGDVVVIRCHTVDSDRLAAVSKKIKSLGFHWVTIDLSAVSSTA
jgi:hypothetical protein